MAGSTSSDYVQDPEKLTGFVKTRVSSHWEANGSCHIVPLRPGLLSDCPIPHKNQPMWRHLGFPAAGWQGHSTICSRVTLRLANESAGA